MISTYKLHWLSDQLLSTLSNQNVLMDAKKGTDSQRMLEWLNNMQREEGAYVAYGHDGTYQLRRVFFALAGMRMSFAAYGQLIIVDATCKTNRSH